MPKTAGAHVVQQFMELYEFLSLSFDHIALLNNTRDKPVFNFLAVFVIGIIHAA